MGNSLARDTNGSALLEFTLVFPLLLVVVLGIIDVGLLVFRYAGVSNATYNGVRYAVVSNPVATGVNAPTTGKNGTVNGQSCSDSSGTPTACNEIDIYCIADSGTSGSCKKVDGTASGYAFDNGAFQRILDKMNSVSLGVPIKRQEVKISYQSTGLGYVGRVAGSQMNVTVAIRCKTTQLYFLDAFIKWGYSVPSNCSDVSPAPAAGIKFPPFDSTLPSEDMTDN